MEKHEIEAIVKKFEAYHEADKARDEALLAEVMKLTERTLDSIDEASLASNIRTKIVQRTTIWNTQWLKLASGALIFAGLLILVAVYIDPEEIADELRKFLPAILTAVLGGAVYLLGVEAPKKIEKSASELPSTDHQPRSHDTR